MLSPTPLSPHGVAFYKVRGGERGVLHVSWVCFPPSLSLSSQKQKRTCGEALGQAKFLNSVAKHIFQARALLSLPPSPASPPRLALSSLPSPSSQRSRQCQGPPSTHPFLDSLQEAWEVVGSLCQCLVMLGSFKPDSSYWSFSEWCPTPTLLSRS